MESKLTITAHDTPTVFCIISRWISSIGCLLLLYIPIHLIISGHPSMVPTSCIIFLLVIYVIEGYIGSFRMPQRIDLTEDAIIIKDWSKLVKDTAIPYKKLVLGYSRSIYHYRLFLGTKRHPHMFKIDPRLKWDTRDLCDMLMVLAEHDIDHAMRVRYDLLSIDKDKHIF